MECKRVSSRYPDVTQLLGAWGRGDRQAADTLLTLLYDKLRFIAHRQLGRLGAPPTFNTTALVHEVYLKLDGREAAAFQDRQHFLAVAARAMRQLIIDYARERRALKRGGGTPHLLLDELDSAAVQVDTQAETLLTLDMALTRLADADARLAQVVELRFFGGLSVEEVAEVLDVSTPTVKRDTRAARAFLRRMMGTIEPA